MMDAIEKRAREPNPNVAVIHEAMQHFPEGSWMRGALDHAAAELAVLHGRCQRAALTPPDGYVLVPVGHESVDFYVCDACGHHYMQDGVNCDCIPSSTARPLRHVRMIAARPEVPNVND